MSFLKTVWIALFLIVMAETAVAETHTVAIHHMELDNLPDGVRVGDVVTFDNRSDMAHNLYVTYADGSVDNLHTQIPGVKRSVTLRHPGAATVKCWIHPIINLEVVIAPADNED